MDRWRTRCLKFGWQASIDVKKKRHKGAEIQELLHPKCALSPHSPPRSAASSESNNEWRNAGKLGTQSGRIKSQ